MLAPTYPQANPQSLAQAPIPQADLDRKQHMALAWKAYRGEFQPPLKVSANQPDDNTISNRCAPIVDKGVSFLFGPVMKIEATDETAQPETRVQDFLDGLWGDDDDRMTLLAQIALNGGVCGMPFVKLLLARGTMKYPRLVVMDPQLVRLVTSPDDCSLVLAYVIEYPGVNDMQKRQIITRIDTDGQDYTTGATAVDDTWTIANYQRRQSGAWIPEGSPEEWLYPFPPLFHCQNLPNPNEAWGMPDLTPDLIKQNQVLNFVQSNTSRILKFHAHPKTWGKGFRASQMSVAVDDVFVIESPDGILQNLEMHSDLHSSLQFIATIRDNMDEQSRVPAVALGRLESLPKGNISGVALQLLFQPLIEKTTLKRRLYGRMIRDISRAALVLAGFISLEAYMDYTIDLNWPSLLPHDDLAAAQEAVLLRGLGVSATTLLSELGYEAEAEFEKSQAEAAKLPPAADGGMNTSQQASNAGGQQQ